MLERESGDIPAKFRLWEETLSGVTKVFVHRITGSRAYIQPNERGGGVLADEMGTGKSLSTLALITRTLDAAKLWQQQKREARVVTVKVEFYASTTLVIVPSARKSASLAVFNFDTISNRYTNKYMENSLRIGFMRSTGKCSNRRKAYLG